MKPRERVAAALDHVEPDRCPFQSTFTPEFAARLRADLRLDDGRAHNPHGGGNTYELEIALGEDLLLTSVGWANCYYQAEHDYVDEWGVGWRVVPYTTRYGVGHYTEPCDHPLADAAALSSYRPPDPERDELYRDAEWTVHELGDDYWIVGVTVTTIFETAWALRGLEQLLLDLIEAPDLADEILDIPYRYHLAAARRLTELGVDMIWLGDDVGHQTGMLMSPEHWRRFLKPRMAELIATVKAINPRLKVAYHTDGDVRAIIPELIEIGLDVLNPVQPTAMDPAQLERDYGRELCFWGSIDEQHTLPFGSPEDVRREVRERLATLGAGGGLILGPTHHVQLDTPLENFWALVEETTGVARPAPAASRS
ncbi:MAG TPA: uroporphyrinogen decarboxylase family protein [Gaiellaceae bacterium]|nr:uroporphyrinogen decarboxylase family protein [Gaiellaceae bacterium]HVP74744.1 uroporphyrinogen decarboxylase family protein [Gaiellaceae bacterium]